MPCIPAELSGSANIEQYIKKLAIKIHKGYFKPYEKENVEKLNHEDVPITMRMRKRHKFQLSKSEILDIVHSVLVEYKPVYIVAR